MAADDCEALQTHADELREIVRDTLAGAKEVGQFDPTYIDRLRTAIRADDAARDVDARIEEQC